MTRRNSAGLHLPLTVPEYGTGIATLPAGSFLAAGSNPTGPMTGIAVVNVGDLLISQGASLPPLITNQNAAGTEKLLQSVNISSPATTATLNAFTSDYFYYKIRVFNVQTANASEAFNIRTSSNGGTSFDNGGTDYYYSLGIYNTSPASNFTNANTSYMRLDYNSIDPTNGGMNYFELTFVNPLTSQLNPGIMFRGYYYDQGQSGMVYVVGHGRRNATTTINAVRFRLASGGNFASGLFNLYGILT